MGRYNGKLQNVEIREKADDEDQLKIFELFISFASDKGRYSISTPLKSGRPSEIISKQMRIIAKRIDDGDNFLDRATAPNKEAYLRVVSEQDGRRVRIVDGRKTPNGEKGEKG